MDSKKHNLNSNSNIFWTKAEREFHLNKKSSKNSITNNNNVKSVKSEEKLNNNIMKTPIMTTIEFPINENNNNILASNLSADSKIGIKDLCNEDKMRIGNLVKELARKEAEKEDIKKCLENERNLYENKLKEMLEQQDKLIKEKELLLQNFAEKQDKLERLLNKREKRIHKSNEKIQKLNVDANIQRQSNHVNVLFSPKKSSTPNNCSPRSISPIRINELNNKICDDKTSKMSKLQLQIPEKIERNFTKEIDNEIIKIKAKPLSNSTIIHENNDLDIRVDKPIKDHQKINDNNEAEIRKQKLMNQRIELMNEQKMLKNLIEQQERLLREKNDQIMLQQKVHRDRLEQLLTKKTQVNDEALVAQKQIASIPAFHNHPTSFTQKQAALLPMDFTELNINNQIRQTQIRENITKRTPNYNPNSSNNSNASSKLKQENSFDIFDLLVDNNQNTNNKQNRYPQYDYDSYNYKDFRHQNSNQQTNKIITTPTTTIDDDESKLFEEIFFVN